MKEVTIQDIATKANVSKSTVSRVLNGTTAVHPDKRRAVLLATKQLGFEPNFFARSLASGRSMTIGVLTQIIGSPFYDAIAQGVISGLGGTGYSPIFADGQWKSTIEVDAIQALIRRRVDGMALIGGDVPSKELEKLCGDLPTVVVARELSADRHHCLFADNVEGGYQATKHLLELGHRAIAIIRGVQNHPDAIDRFQGYQKALAEHEIELDPRLVLDGDFTSASGVNAIEQLVSSGASFSAVFAANDMTAFGARLALDRHGFDVPKDVSIVGFDDQAEAAFMTPPLTTVRQPAYEMGVQASRWLLALIDGKSFTPDSLPIALQIRDSTAPYQSAAT